MQLIYLSPVPWDSFKQRSHHFVNWFHAETRGQVLWVEPYPTRLPAFKDVLRIGQPVPLRNALLPDWLEVVSPRALPIEPLPAANAVNGLLWRRCLQQIVEFAERAETTVCIGKPSTLANQILKRLPGCFSIYDAMDDFPEFYSGLSSWSMKVQENRVLAAVDRVVASATFTRERLRLKNSHVTLALNAFDAGTLPAVEALELGTKQQIVGYVGTIADWFDWDLVVSLAKANSSVKVQLIGPIFTRLPHNLPGNIELLPACDHGSAMRAMAEFSCGLIPFKCNSLTRSVDPVKYYEYRGLGVPVISTCFGEMAGRLEEEGVRLVDERSDLREVVQSSLSFRYSQDQIAGFRAENSWASRFCGIQWVAGRGDHAAQRPAPVSGQMNMRKE